MSAFMHSNKHISACAVGAAPLVGMSPFDLFRLWRAANARSILVRYGDKGCAKACGPFIPDVPRLTEEQLLKALNSLYYQSCEYPGWKRSKACLLLDTAACFLSGKGVTSTADNAYWSL